MDKIKKRNTTMEGKTTFTKGISNIEERIKKILRRHNTKVDWDCLCADEILKELREVIWTK